MLRVLPLLLLVALLAVTVLLGIGWLRATRLPDWYLAEQGVGLSGPGGPIRISREMLEELEAGRGGQRPVEGLLVRGRTILDSLRTGRPIELDERELELFLLGRLSGDPRGRELLRHARAIRATIEDGSIEVGAILDPSEVPSETWPSEAWSVLRGVAGSVPGNGDQSLYVAMRGTPSAKGGKLVLDRTTTVLVGDLAIRAAWLADRLGEPGWKEGLEVDLGNAYLDDLRVLEHTVLVTLAKPQR